MQSVWQEEEELFKAYVNPSIGQCKPGVFKGEMLHSVNRWDLNFSEI